MRRFVKRKWRPSLEMITAGMVAGIVFLSLAGIVVVRFSIEQPPLVEIVIAALLSLLAGALIGLVFVRTISRPLALLAARARAIGRGDIDAIGDIPRHGTVELAVLTESFMNMAQSLSDRTSYIRSFARHVSHELKAPLTSLRGALELIRDSESMSAAERAAFLANALADVERMHALLERLNEQARAENPDLAGRSTLAEMVARLAPHYPDLAISLNGAVDAILALSCENGLIVLGHLFDNAQRHQARAIALSATPAGEVLDILVQDDGEGVSPGNRGRIFEPFFTTRRAEGGTGMGLAIARAVLAAHGGDIELMEGESGACFRLRAPLAAPEPPARPFWRRWLAVD